MASPREASGRLLLPQGDASGSLLPSERRLVKQPAGAQPVSTELSKEHYKGYKPYFQIPFAVSSWN